jgi:hypothetical protein
MAYGDNKGLVWMAVVGVLFGVVLWLVLTPLVIFVTYVLSFFSAYSLVRNNPHALGPVAYRFSENGYPMLPRAETARPFGKPIVRSTRLVNISFCSL